jgi:UDP-glucose 4-epimerase
MRVLVTGGAGYIGSVVSEELIRQNHAVVVLDSLYKGHKAAVADGAVFVHGDLADGEAVRRTLTAHEIEAVIHMAADSLVGESMVNPMKFYRNNVATGLSLLEAMLDCKVKKLVFSSTAAVYGNPAKQPIEETDETSPTNAYGESKLAVERALQWFDRAHGLRYVSLRYFNAAGATSEHGEWHQPESHLIPILLQVAAGKQKFAEIYGDDYPTRDGTCVRDYIHVVDLARAHILALTAPGEQSKIYNLGCGGEGYTVREVVETCREVTGADIPVRVGPRRAGDPAVLIASSERIRRELQWVPEMQDLRKIISSAWAWLRKHPEGY